MNSLSAPAYEPLILIKNVTLQKTIYILTFIFGTFLNSFGQTATIKIERLFFDNTYEKFDSIYFDINGTKFFGNDTLTKTISVQDNFDKCIAIIGKDTLIFLCKFQNEQEYVISPGCCCAAFTLKARQNANRGTVSFKNKSDRDLGIVVCGHNSDTVKTDSLYKVFASESAMCYFKPCRFQIVETSYFSDEYNYKNDERDYDELWILQKKFILNQIWFHFLHGEKIEIIFNDVSKNIELKIIGYLTKAEIDKF